MKRVQGGNVEIGDADVPKDRRWLLYGGRLARGLRAHGQTPILIWSTIVKYGECATSARRPQAAARLSFAVASAPSARNAATHPCRGDRALFGPWIRRH